MNKINATMLACLVVAAFVTAAAQLAYAQGVAIGANFHASNISEAGFLPPDTMGAVGGEHVMLFINGRYELYTKNPPMSGIDGVPIAGQASSLSSFWTDTAGVSGLQSYAFDPRVTYDPTARRWYAVSADGKASTASGYLLAVSKTADPTDGWNGFRLPAQPVLGSNWVDFPMLGFDGQYVYVSSDNFGLGGAYSKYPLHAFPKADLLADSPTIANRQTLLLDYSTNQVTAAFDGLGPADQPYHLWEEGANSLTYDTVTESGGILVGSVGSVAIGETYYEPLKSRQPDGTADLEIDNNRISSRLVRINGSYWGVYPRRTDDPITTRPTFVRWFEIDASTMALKQEGTITLADQDFSYPSIAVSAAGDVTVGFTACGPNPGQYPSAYAAVGRTDAEGNTTFDTPFLLQAGTTSYHRDDSSARNRWGDYSNTVNDPADPRIFWTFQEWASGSNIWSVQATEIIAYGPEEAYWRCDSDGQFSDDANWLNGSHATSGQTAVFSRTGCDYTVTLDADTALKAASIRQGNVTWNLAGRQLALTEGAGTSLAVSQFQGSSELTISNGTLESSSATVATGAGSSAEVVLAGADWINAGIVTLGGVAGQLGGNGVLQLNAGTMQTDTLQVGLNSTVRLNGAALTAEDILIGAEAGGPATLDIADAASTVTVRNLLSFGTGGSAVAVAGSTIHMAGADLDNHSTNPTALAGLENVRFIFDDAEGASFLTIEVAGEDRGAAPAGWQENFAVAALTLGGAGPGRIHLVDTFDNLPESQADEALYVGDLTLGAGAVVCLDGLNLYYLNGHSPKQFFVGDIQLDGDVSIFDWAVFQVNFGTGSEATWAEGDFDGDGDVDVFDFIPFQQAYGSSSAAANPVPEPATFALLLAACPAVLKGRRHCPRRRN